jgi:hypothetical protein
MSDGITAHGGNTPDDSSSGPSTSRASGAVDAAKETVGTAASEASNVAGTTAESAVDVAVTAKDEATGVAREAKSQVQDLYHQAQSQLSSQAAQQQERIASGLRSFGDELSTLTRNAESNGLATDLVQQASTRLSAAGEWLADRDPAALLDEVKAFARRRPVVFIAAAAVAGIVVGRLTRALAAGGSSNDSSNSPAPAQAPATPQPSFGAPAAAAGTVPAFVAVDVAPSDSDSPPFSESAARLTASYEEVPDDRRDTV